MNSPNPTAEPLKSWEVNNNAWEAFAAEEHMTNGIQAAYEAGLRAHGLLSEGAPSEEPVEEHVSRIARDLARATELTGANAEVIAKAALKLAAGVAPQEPQALDPEKVADVIHHAFPADSPYRCTHIINAPCVALATALCEAAKRGELS